MVYLASPDPKSILFQTKTQQANPSAPRQAATNRTLGFQKILALSTSPSWRTRGLLAAAEYTGLDIEIPPQVPVAQEVADAFRRIGENDSTVPAHPNPGATRAWLAHLDLIKHVVYSGYETALIVEDDVDWDVSLRTQQIALLSDAVRNFTAVPANDTSPYGRDWDILWLGHCGEHTDPDTPRVEYVDTTTPQHADYSGWTAPDLNNFGEGRRVVQRAVGPVCTFAYALTAAGARNVLAWAGTGGVNQAFDIRLLEACQRRALRVVSVQPEIMHQYMPPNEEGYWSEVDRANGLGSSADKTNWDGIMGITENILESARCRVLFGSTCMKGKQEER